MPGMCIKNRWLSMSEACEQFGFTQTTVWRWGEERKLKRRAVKRSFSAKGYPTREVYEYWRADLERIDRERVSRHKYPGWIPVADAKDTPYNFTPYDLWHWHHRKCCWLGLGKKLARRHLLRLVNGRLVKVAHYRREDLDAILRARQTAPGEPHVDRSGEWWPTSYIENTYHVSRQLIDTWADRSCPELAGRKLRHKDIYRPPHCNTSGRVRVWCAEDVREFLRVRAQAQSGSCRLPDAEGKWIGRSTWKDGEGIWQTNQQLQGDFGLSPAYVELYSKRMRHPALDPHVNGGKLPRKQVYWPFQAHGVNRCKWVYHVDSVRRMASWNKEREGREERAIQFLRDLLGDSAVDVNEVKKMARGAGVSETYLNRAKAILQVRWKKYGYGSLGRVLWFLPDVEPPTSPSDKLMETAPVMPGAASDTRREKSSRSADDYELQDINPYATRVSEYGPKARRAHYETTRDGVRDGMLEAMQAGGMAVGDGMSGRRSGRSKIPADRRTIPLSMKDAAKYMGYGGNKAGVKKLRAAMDVQAVTWEKHTRQSFVFDRQDFPRENWSEVVPTDPN